MCIEETNQETWENVSSNICALRRLNSTCASTQSDQSLRCPHEEALHLWVPKIRPVTILIRLRECVYCSYIIRLLLLTMTIPNQMLEVLLFVCSMMADETYLSSKLPVADRAVFWGRRHCWRCLALAFRWARSCSAALVLFASYLPAPLLMRPCHFARSCAIWSHDSVGMLKSLWEALRVSLFRFFWPPWERFPTYSSP